MKIQNFISALFICCLSLSCSKESPPTEMLPQPAPPEVYPGFTVSNEFGLKLYREIYREYPDSNLCVSPFSVLTALSLIANGTAGKDLEEILNALNMPDVGLDEVNEDYKHLSDYLMRADPKVTYESANSFWYQTGIDVFQPFRSDLASYYNAEVYPVDFKWPGTLNLINKWVSDKTHGKIKWIVRVIPPNTLANLTNAIYFNGEWTFKFDKTATKPWKFYKLNRTQVKIAVMENKQAYRYYYHPAWHGLEMTYGSGNWAMYLFMPRQTGSLDKMTDWLLNNWNTVRKNFEPGDPMLVYLPQFTTENEFDLIPFLESLGIYRVFCPGADFSRMLKEPIYLGQVIHKTYIKVNEDGTEAAAVTSGWPLTGDGRPPGLFFDHPFTYIIAERTTGLILFIGQITDPT